MDIVIRRGSLRDAPNKEYRDQSILLVVTHADPQAQVHLRGGSADHDGSAASTFEARKRQHHARPGHVSFDVRSHKHATSAVESFGRLGVEGSNFMDQLAASVVWERDGWRVDDKEGGGEGTPAPNHLGDYTGRHFEESVALQTPA